MKIRAWILILFPLSVYAQSGYSDAGARSNSMGNASVTLTDVFAAQNNPAAMPYLEQASAGISTQNFFLVEGGINAYYGAGTLPVGEHGAFGLTAHFTGDETFNQTKIGIGYGRKLLEALSVGVQLDYLGTRTGEVGSGQAITFDIGVLYTPTKTVRIGAKAFNPIRAENGMPNPEPLPSLINVGLSWQPSDKIILCIEGEQEMTNNLRIKSGLEYHIAEVLFLRGGYISNPSMFTTGFGLKWQSINIDASVQFHQQLGASPGFGLRYAF